MKPEHFKPFNIEHAKAGAPYCCRDGAEVTVLKWDGRSRNSELVGCIGETDIPATWNSEGTHCGRDFDLVMTPLGYIDGKPVFVGDELIDPSGATFAPGPRDTGHLSDCRWPELAKVYPSTLMTHDEMWGAIRKVVPVQFSIGVTNLGAPYGVEDVTAAIANAALRHACESAQVVPMADVQEVARNLAAKDRVARDLAIAEAVRAACALKTNGAWASLSGSVAACAVWKRIQEEIDPAAIIAKIPA